MSTPRTLEQLQKLYEGMRHGQLVALTAEELKIWQEAAATKPVPKETALDEQVGGSHYKNMRIQPIEYCEANELGACESAIVKYITRWREKGGHEDLRKIKHYVDLLIEMDGKYNQTKDVQK